MKMQRNNFARLSIASLLIIGFSISDAPAGTSVTYMREGGLATTVLDGDIEDLDPTDFGIKVEFIISNPGLWTATGTIIAKGMNDTPITTIVTDALIVNDGGGSVINEAFIVKHEFTSTLTAIPYSAHLSGVYDKVGLAGNIGIADILYIPRVNTTDIGVIDPPAAVNVPPPKPFGGMSGAVFPPEPPVSNTLMFRFYLDETGDAIRMFNSASIRQVPEPATAVILLIGTVGAMRRRTPHIKQSLRGGAP